MTTFIYQARDEGGRQIKGVLEADSQQALAERLRKMGLLVTRIDEKGNGIGFPEISFARKINEEHLLLTAIQLSNMVEAGVPLVTSVKTVASQTSHLKLKQALERVALEVEEGSTFSQALARHPDVFPKLMVSLVTVGEAGGHLDTVLNRFANFVEKDLALRRQVQGALLYPAFLVAAATLLILFVVTFVVPQFAALFAKAGLSMPLPTLILKGIGETIRSYWWALALLAAACAVAGGYALKTSPVRIWADGILLRAPGVGPVIYQTIIARFTRTLGTLVGGGLPILSALETAQGVVGNHVLEKEVERLRQAVERGERMAATLSVGKVFHPDAIQMIKVGEESGRLDVMLERIADFYELRVNFYVKQMTTLFEPILLILMGIMVAFIMASLLLPMFDMVKVLQRGGLRG